jgi:hypothetical protein
VTACGDGTLEADCREARIPAVTLLTLLGLVRTATVFYLALLVGMRRLAT